MKADHSYVYRVTYTAQNGKQSQQAFAIAVSGDAPADYMNAELTVDATTLSGSTADTTEATVLSGSTVVLKVSPTTGWSDDYLWDNGQKGNTITVSNLVASRTYTCQYVNQSGAVSECRFKLNVVPAKQAITVSDGAPAETNEVKVLAGSKVTLQLIVPAATSRDDVTWSDGSHGLTYTVASIDEDMTVTATFRGVAYTFTLKVKADDYSYYDLLTNAKGYKLLPRPRNSARWPTTAISCWPVTRPTCSSG